MPITVARPTFAFGEADGDEVYWFGQIAGVAMDAAGRYVVADAQANTVRVYDAAGTYLFTVASAGGGPGEVGRPCCVAFDAAGRLWVRDPDNARYNVYRLGDSAAAYVELRRIAHASPGFRSPTTFDAEGRLIDVGMQPRGETFGLLDIARYHLNDASEVVRRELVLSPPRDSLGLAVLERGADRGPLIRAFWQPFGARLMVTHGRDGSWARAVTSAYRIEWFDASGGRTLIERELPGPPLSASERREADASLDEQLERWGFPRSRLPFTVPARKAPVRGLLIDDRGRLWVELSVAAGAPRRAHVYERSGARAMTIEWPAEISLDPGQVGDRAAVGVARDDLGIERVVRLEW